MAPLIRFAMASDALFNDGSVLGRAGISISTAVPEPSAWAMLVVAQSVTGPRVRQQGRKTASTA